MVQPSNNNPQPKPTTHKSNIGRLLTTLILATTTLILMRWVVTPTAASAPPLPPLLSTPLLTTATTNAILADIPSWFSEQSALSSAAAWADIDNDGDLDLAIADANGAHNLYLNHNGALPAEPDWSALDGSNSFATSLAWGDIDGDGDPDLVVGYAQHIRIYRNNNGRLGNAASWYSDFTPFKIVASIALGDINGDGHLDIIAGNFDANNDDGNITGRNEIYYNDGSGQISNTTTFNKTADWQTDENNRTYDLAVADLNNDGRLDIITADAGFADSNNELGGLNHVYLNNNGTIPTTASFTWGDTDRSQGLTLGDVNGDGWLDVAVANMPIINAGITITPQSKLYLNTGGTLSATAVWTTTLGDFGRDVAFGDADGDGDLDLALAVMPDTTTGVDILGGQNRLYLNENGTLATTPAWSDPAVDVTYSVAWGDVNGDGQLDLALANQAGQDKLYLNQHLPIPAAPVWSSAEQDASMDVTWGDYDADGDLDLAVANNRAIDNGFYIGGENRIYNNQNGQLQLAWSSNEAEDSFGVAWADVNNDGALALAIANGAIEVVGFGPNPPSPNRLYAPPPPASFPPPPPSGLPQKMMTPSSSRGET